MGKPVNLRLVSDTFESFEAAPVVSKKGAPKDKYVRKPMPNIELISKNRSEIKSLTAINGTLEAELREAMLAEFVATGTKLRRRPDSFIGTENGSTAMCSLSRKTKALTEDEQRICRKHKIRLETTTEEYFQFDNDYLEDPEIMARVVAALKAAKLPGGIIKKVSDTTVTVSEESISDAFQLSPKACAEVLPILTGTAIQPKVNNVAVRKVA